VREASSQCGADIEAAARILEAGRLVAFPTETVYGLGADAENPDAVMSVFKAKGRPADHPLIVHLAADADPEYWSSDVNASARKLISAFWPGPLTLILPRAPHIPDVVAGGQNSIGLRCPAHPVAQALLREFKAGKGGIAAPSANRFGRISPTTASHVHEEFYENPSVACVLEGGQSTIGIESTIIDLTRSHPVLLRPGSISVMQIADLLGVMPRPPDVQAPRVSGSLASHYAPSTPVVVMPALEMSRIGELLSSGVVRVALMHYTTLAAINFQGCETVASVQMPVEPAGYAHNFYAALRQLDSIDADVIVVEALPDDDSWGAVADRLMRAAHTGSEVLKR